MDYRCKDSVLKYDSPVPRYTSYPTAPHFKSLENTGHYQAHLASLPLDQPVSLYIHVPFCAKLCWYCGCHTKVTQRYHPVSDYVALLLKEIGLVASKIPKNLTVSHIHFGGGTPSLLAGEDFSRIMEALRTVFSIRSDVEIAMEMDPRGLSKDRLAQYVASGLNRVSIGVQDFDDTVLKAINREQPYSLTYSAVTQLHDLGVDGINFDILYGLPYQTLSSFEKTIDLVLGLRPSRISVFGYAHVPWFKKHMRLIAEDALPNTDLRYDLSMQAHQCLEQAGYMPIGIDHYALPDDPLYHAAKEGGLRRNFQGYTTDTADTLIGLGISAIGAGINGFYQNYADMPLYAQALDEGRLPMAKSCAVTAEDKVRAVVIEQIMCYLWVDVPVICQAYGFAPTHLDACLQALGPFITDGIVINDGPGKFFIPSHARLATRHVAAVFDAYRHDPAGAAQGNAPRHAQGI